MTPMQYAYEIIEGKFVGVMLSNPKPAHWQREFSLDCEVKVDQICPAGSGLSPPFSLTAN
jgi:hypothetical protein